MFTLWKLVALFAKFLVQFLQPLNCRYAKDAKGKWRTGGAQARIPKRELPPTTSCHRGAGWAGDRAKSIPGVIVVLFHIFDYSLPSSQNINFY